MSLAGLFSVGSNIVRGMDEAQLRRLNANEARIRGEQAALEKERLQFEFDQQQAEAARYEALRQQQLGVDLGNPPGLDVSRFSPMGLYQPQLPPAGPGGSPPPAGPGGSPPPAGPGGSPPPAGPGGSPPPAGPGGSPQERRRSGRSGRLPRQVQERRQEQREQRRQQVEEWRQRQQERRQERWQEREQEREQRRQEREQEREQRRQEREQEREQRLRGIENEQTAAPAPDQVTQTDMGFTMPPGMSPGGEQIGGEPSFLDYFMGSAQAAGPAAALPPLIGSTIDQMPDTPPAEETEDPPPPPTEPPRVFGAEDFYRANVNNVPEEIRQVMQQRDEMAQLARMYQQAGFGNEYTQLRFAVREMDNQILVMHGNQGVQELNMFNDPRRLAAVWSRYAGTEIQIEPRTDGNYNIKVGGRHLEKDVDANTLSAQARLAFSAAYRERESEIFAERSGLEYETYLDIQKKNADHHAAMFREIFVAQAQGNINQATELYKQLFRGDVHNAGDYRNVIIKPPGSFEYYLFSPEGLTQVIDGVEIKSGEAVRINGLPSYANFFSG